MPPKKVSVGSVRGRIRVIGENGVCVTQWGGTECFLSLESGLGPLFVVTSAAKKKHPVMFSLVGLRQVMAAYVPQGRLTLVLSHQCHRSCTVFVTAQAEDIAPLRLMAATLQDRSRWRDIERNVAKGGVGATRQPAAAESDVLHSEPFAAATGAVEADGENEYHEIVASHGNTPTSLVNSRGIRIAHSIAHLTPSQQRAVTLVEQGNNVFVTGCAGSGKTELIRHLAAKLSASAGGAFALTAVTGAAARLIQGSTVNSFCGIGLGDGTPDEMMERIKAKPDTLAAWRRLKVWVIDEIGMLSASLLTLLDVLARRIKKQPNEPFGGIQMILVGDFLQLPPIASRAANNGALPYCFAAQGWASLGLKCVELVGSVRHEEDKRFARCLRDVRMGRYTALVEQVLGSCVNRRLKALHGVAPTRIMALLKDVDNYNQSKLDALDTPNFQRYQAQDITYIDGMAIDNEVPQPASLVLKEGAQVVVVMNVELGDGSALRNGDRGVVTRFTEETHDSDRSLPVVRFADGREQVVSFATSEVVAHGRVLATRSQLPLKLAWALTSHKCQGMTLPAAEVSLDKSFFETGQAYVALSRVRRAQDLCLTSFDPSVIRADPPCVALYRSLFGEEDDALPLQPAEENGAEAKGLPDKRQQPSPRVHVVQVEGGEQIGFVDDGEPQMMTRRATRKRERTEGDGDAFGLLDADEVVEGGADSATRSPTRHRRRVEGGPPSGDHSAARASLPAPAASPLQPKHEESVCLAADGQPTKPLESTVELSAVSLPSDRNAQRVFADLEAMDQPIAAPVLGTPKRRTMLLDDE